MELGAMTELATQAIDRSTTSMASNGLPTDQIPGLLWGFRIHDDGSADPLPLDQPIDNRHDGWLWLHLDLSNLRALEWLSHSGLPQPAITNLVSRDRHQQLHTTPACIYGVFADHKRGIDGVSEELAHLRFAMTERLLISGRHHALAAVESVRDVLATGGARLASAGALLELIVEHVADAIDRVTDDLAGDLDQIEDCLARRTEEFERPKLTNVRRTTVRLHRQLAGLRTVFHRLERQGTDEVPSTLRFAAGKLAQRLDALDQDILEMRERGHRIQEEVSAMIAEETNRHLYILTIVTTLFLPPTLVTGVFGMNTKGLPLTDVETGFLWAAALMVCSSLVVYLVMRRIGIFKSMR
jgi:zinc transporter